MLGATTRVGNSRVIENFHVEHQKSLAFVFFEEYIHAGSGT
jgi:hypothetical protein